MGGFPDYLCGGLKHFIRLRDLPAIVHAHKNGVSVRARIPSVRKVGIFGLEMELKAKISYLSLSVRLFSPKRQSQTATFAAIRR